MKRVQNKHRRSAKKHLKKNKSKSRSRKYKIGAGGETRSEYQINKDRMAAEDQAARAAHNATFSRPPVGHTSTNPAPKPK